MRRQDERHARHAGPCCLNQAETTVDSSLRGSGGERPTYTKRAPDTRGRFSHLMGAGPTRECYQTHVPPRSTRSSLSRPRGGASESTVICIDDTYPRGGVRIRK